MHQPSRHLKGVKQVPRRFRDINVRCVATVSSCEVA
jgi:hypothetical protein